MHGNRSRKPAKSLDKSFSDNIILLYQKKYNGFNFKHFYEYLIEEENINVSYTFVYTTLMNLENKTEEEIEIIVNNEVVN